MVFREIRLYWDVERKRLEGWWLFASAFSF